MKNTHRWMPALLVALLMTVPGAKAADLLTDAMQQAYAPYRAALFQTNGSSASAARDALQQAQQAWDTLVQPLAQQPGPPYAQDAALSASFASVRASYANALVQIQAGQLAQAHETLEQVRDTLAAVRQRNQVVVLSDHMNAYHAEMEAVLHDGASMLETPQGMAQLTARSGVLLYLARQLQNQAPAQVAAQPQFGTLSKAVEQSVRALQAALFVQDAGAARTALGRLKPAYSQLFLRFG